MQQCIREQSHAFKNIVSIYAFEFVYRGVIVNERELNYSSRKPAGFEGAIDYLELTIHRYTNENDQLNVTYCYCCSKNKFYTRTL